MTSYRTRSAGLWLLVLTTTVCTTGCVGATAQLIYMLKGVVVDAEFEGLRNKRVAVVCVSASPTFGRDTTSEMLARYLDATLEAKVRGIRMVRQNEVLDWIDNNNWDQVDFSQIGRGVEADMLLAVELSSYGLNNGKTLYQGRADVTVSVYDIAKDGELVFRRTIPEYLYPKNGGQPAIDTTRQRFEKKFIHMLSQKIASYFYDYEMVDDFGRDATTLGD